MTISEHVDEEGPSPPKKQKPIPKRALTHLPKKLSNKERKRLEKIVEKKNNREQRPDLYKELQKYQLNSSVYEQMGSFANLGQNQEKTSVQVKKRGILPKSTVKGLAVKGLNKRKSIVQEDSSDTSEAEEESIETMQQVDDKVIESENENMDEKIDIHSMETKEKEPGNVEEKRASELLKYLHINQLVKKQISRSEELQDSRMNLPM